MKDAVRTSIIRDRQRQRFDEFTKKLKEKAKISVNDKLLSSLEKEEAVIEPPITQQPKKSDE